MSPHRRQKDKPVTTHALAVAMARFAGKAKGPGAKTWREQPPTPHDLRRTARTLLSRIGTPDELCDRILNHAPPASDTGNRVYNLHRFENEKRAALENLARTVAAIIDTLSTPEQGHSNTSGRHAKAHATAG